MTMPFRSLIVVFVALLAWAMPQVGRAQSQEEMARRSDAILKKVRQVDLLNQILPILLTKDQIDKLLPALEKARGEVKKAEKAEFEFLKSLEAKLDKSITEAIDKGKVPMQEDVKTIYVTFRTLVMKRSAVIEDNTDTVYEVVDKVFTTAQKKEVANSLQISQLNPGVDVKKMDETAKVKFFIKVVLLDPPAYDLLVKLSQKK